jgi:hypothetical protein
VPSLNRRTLRCRTLENALGGRGTPAASRARTQRGGALAARERSSGGGRAPGTRAAERAAHEASLECTGAQSGWERSPADRAQRAEHRMWRFRGTPRVGRDTSQKIGWGTLGSPQCSGRARAGGRGTPGSENPGGVGSPRPRESPIGTLRLLKVVPAGPETGAGIRRASEAYSQQVQPQGLGAMTCASSHLA